MRKRPRRGLTVVEVLTAILLLTIAVLGLAATSGHLVALETATGIRTLATARLMAVTDSLRAAGCARLVSGADSSSAVRVIWTVTAGTRTRSVHTRATFNDRRSHTIATEGMVACE